MLVDLWIASMEVDVDGEESGVSSATDAEDFVAVDVLFNGAPTDWAHTAAPALKDPGRLSDYQIPVEVENIVAALIHCPAAIIPDLLPISIEIGVPADHDWLTSSEDDVAILGSILDEEVVVIHFGSLEGASHWAGRRNLVQVDRSFH